ncbi:MAG TPA: response regulator transcription factor [Chloroflexota bacterium]|nr:response regulator transcription factor [Chloroflexota bacterium]
MSDASRRQEAGETTCDPADPAADSPHVLVIDDECSIIDVIRIGLRLQGFTVDGASTGPAGLEMAQRVRPDVIVLDVMLPELDGLAVCRRLRTMSDVPIIMLTARDEVDDRILGLDSGADDYLIKPFSVGELAARVRALLRRRQPLSGDVLRMGDLTLDHAAREILIAGRQVTLTAREYDLLYLFMRHPRQVLTRDAIVEGVWGYDYPGDDNIVDVYVRSLRAKLGDQPPRRIQTVRGVGYALKE